MIVKIISENAFYIFSLIGYSVFEYMLGKSKKIESSSLIELILKNILRRK
jgi:hypothetical protein